MRVKDFTAMSRIALMEIYCCHGSSSPYMEVQVYTWKFKSIHGSSSPYMEVQVYEWTSSSYTCMYVYFIGVALIMYWAWSSHGQENTFQKVGAYEVDLGLLLLSSHISTMLHTYEAKQLSVII